MGIKHIIVKAANKAADKVANLSALSPEQLKQVDDNRTKYLSEAPDPKDEIAVELTCRLIAASSVEIYNSYLPQISELYTPVSVDVEYDSKFNSNYNIRYMNITKWVMDKDENSIDKLVNVYEVLSNENCNIALVFNRTAYTTNVYLGVSNLDNATDNSAIDDYIERLQSAVYGNFPGSELGEINPGVLPCFKSGCNYSVASASNIPTEKSEKFISQTIEKLLDGIVPDEPEKDYTIVLLASPIRDVEERKIKLAEFYSALNPYASWQTNYTFTETDSTNSMAIFGVNVGASAGVQNSQSTTNTQSASETENTSDTKSENTSTSKQMGSNKSKSDSTSLTNTESSSEMHQISNGETEQVSTNVNRSSSFGTTRSTMTGSNSSDNFHEEASVGADIAGVNGNVSGGLGHTDGTSSSSSKSTASSNNISIGRSDSSGVSRVVTKGGTRGESIGSTITKNTLSGVTKSVTNSVGKSIAQTIGKAVTTGVSWATGTAKATSFGMNAGANFARSSSVTANVGKNEGITQSFVNYNIKHALEKLEQQMKRYETSTALGMWDFAAYVISEDYNVANNVAHTYIALTQGEESYMSQSSINLWRGDLGEESFEAKEIYEYIRDFRHPLFGLNPAVVDVDLTFNVYPTVVNPTTALSGKELAYSLNFPRKSISGLPVIECAEFGRNVSVYDDVNSSNEATITLGNIFHMNHIENVKVELSKQSLASHAFITGSTGSGKSNTVYKLLDEAMREDIKFLVVEPAKGEYKHVFGNERDVSVYGTNPKLMDMLRINPFSFPSDIHVLEHIDRLVELFNVCWPMYAAMPAVLKSAVEKSYVDCGWDLMISSNSYSEDLYPTFTDVARNVKSIIDTSEYDSENKGAYKGSLLTRLQSLCNGINGLIFVQDEIDAKALFDENVIVDISRVGSSETKSLIMGMLILKLQEYRMSEVNGMNSKLKHITVLEEAHNILKGTSTEQSTEGANLLGKSVEMISNAIAEMRSYGEGFIIADQAPGLLDMAVIRNTNTKIIMRLPDRSDRELVGQAANLNENQIVELAKLPCGVAAVYQNEWIQPVLCKVDKYETDSSLYEFNNPKIDVVDDLLEERLEIATLLSNGTGITDINKMMDLNKSMRRLKLDSSIIVIVNKFLASPLKEPRMTKFAPIMKALFPEVYKAIKASHFETNNMTEWTASALGIVDSYAICRQVKRDIVQSVMTYYFVNELNDTKSLIEWRKNGGF